MLDLLGSCLSLLCTYYFIQMDKKAWVLSLFAIGINIYLYWQKGIYAEAILEIFYFVSSGLGFILWRNPAATCSSPIRTLSLSNWGVLVMSLFSLFFLIRTILIYTPSTIPNWDACTTTLSILAQCLMGYKIITTWILWLVTDLLYVYIYLQKTIPFHALMAMIYTGMALQGYRTWHKKLHAATNTRVC